MVRLAMNHPFRGICIALLAAGAIVAATASPADAWHDLVQSHQKYRYPWTAAPVEPYYGQVGYYVPRIPAQYGGRCYQGCMGSCYSCRAGWDGQVQYEGGLPYPPRVQASFEPLKLERLGTVPNDFAIAGPTQ